MTTSTEILVAARERISKRADWTRYAMARDCHGHSVETVNMRTNACLLRSTGP